MGFLRKFFGNQQQSPSEQPPDPTPPTVPASPAVDDRESQAQKETVAPATPTNQPAGEDSPPDVEALQAAGDVEGLIHALAYPGDENIRMAAASALGALGDPRAVHPLLAALKDEYIWMPSRVRDALGKLGAAVETLIPVLGSADAKEREVAASALGEIGATAALEPLVALLTDEKPEVRTAAAGAMASICTRPQTTGELAQYEQPLLAVLASDGNSEVQMAAVRALAHIGGAASVGPLLAIVEARNYQVSRDAILALGEIGARLDDEAVRESIAEALIPLFDYVAGPMFQTLNRMALWRWAAAKALGQINRLTSADLEAWYAVATEDWDRAVALGDAAIEPLRTAAFMDGSVMMRKAAIPALGRIGSPEAVRMIVTALGARLSNVGDEATAELLRLAETGTPVFDPVMEALEHNVPDMRKAAAGMLGKLGNGQAIGPLSRCINDPDAFVGSAAVAALARLATTVKDGALRTQAVNAVRSALDHGEYVVRLEAEKAMEKLG